MALSSQALLGLILFAFVTSVTPGPNNLMLLASGVNFGFRRSLPHMFGIGIGFTLMLAVVGLGLGGAILAVPLLYIVLKVVSIAYLFWLAFMLATSGSLGVADSGGRPMRFHEAALFQWINPKAWAMALTASAVYTRPEAIVASAATVALVFGAINLPTVGIWAAFGTLLRGVLADPARLRVFNLVMAGLLIASILPFAFEGWGG
jgi:threonine/homoserine/homoserine lactone efflux protein